MNKNRHNLVFFLSLSILFSSCGAKKNAKNKPVVKRPTKTVNTPNVETNTSTKTVATKKITTTEYIKEYAKIAIEQMKKHKIPASISLAQGILESGSGNSSLTKVSNNHFGIKCHKNWEGARTYYDDDEKGECFRVYNNSSYSYNDHSEFLTSRKRYAKLFKLNPGDYKGWAKGLKKAGYATDKKYPQKLIGIIEKYELYKYDEKVLGSQVSNDPNIYIVQPGDGLYGIARKFNINLNTLMLINDLKESNIYAGQRLFLKKSNIVVENPVKEVAATPRPNDKVKTIKPSVEETVKILVETKEDGIKTEKSEEVTVQSEPKHHLVQVGENLYQIAYKYKLAIPDLRRWNGIKKNEIKVGQRLWIKDPKQYKKIQIIGDTHTVVLDDTLYSIAKRYKLSVKELMRLNNLPNYTIYIGQVLLVK